LSAEVLRTGAGGGHNQAIGIAKNSLNNSPNHMIGSPSPKSYFGWISWYYAIPSIIPYPASIWANHIKVAYTYIFPDRFIVYINGTKALDRTISGSDVIRIMPDLINGRISFGASQTSDYFQGYYRNIKMFDRELTDVEIQQLT